MPGSPGSHISCMFERHWGVIMTTETWDSPEPVDGTSGETNDPSQPKLILRTPYELAKAGLGIGLLAALPYMIEACERGAYPFADRCAPFANLPDAIKSISSTSTDSLSASMIASQPRLTFTAAAPNSSGLVSFESLIFKRT